jgi:aminoglycoside phosphotransferase (APT) family kinase protein
MHVARLSDVAFWRPYVAEILARHDLPDAARLPAAGFNPTHPTFVSGDVVVKLFGLTPRWRASHAAERAAHALVAKDAAITAPRLVAEGRLFDDDEAPWPYLVTTRMRGVAWREASLALDERRRVAAELGEQVRSLHALPTSGAATAAHWPGVDLVAGARRSSLPPRLVGQVADFVARLGPSDEVFVHGDLVASHVFVEGGRLAGIIDWGDAMAADRHYEIIQVHRDLFDCDKSLLRAFLDAAAWPTDGLFAERALGHGLVRQAVGLAQHGSMDVFEPIAARFDLDRIETLDRLAAAVFAV